MAAVKLEAGERTLLRLYLEERDGLIAEGHAEGVPQLAAERVQARVYVKAERVLAVCVKAGVVSRAS